MKNSRHFFTYSFICMLFWGLISCSVENGQDGAVGPQGPAGIDGVDGEDGNANVIASSWFDAPDDIFSGIAEMIIPLNSLNVENFDNSAFLVYARTSGFIEGTWPQGQTTLLPASVRSSTDFKVQMDFFFTTENLTIRYWQDPFLEFISFPSETQFRYVIIPSVSDISGKNDSLDYNKLSYDEVTELFGLSP